MAQVEEEGKSKEEMEAEITSAMKRRLADFKAKADSLTLEGVRRALEKELGMKTFTLDVHKKFIKQCMEKYFYGPTETNIPVTTNENSEEAIQPGLGNGQQKRLDPPAEVRVNGENEGSVNTDEKDEEEIQKTDDVQHESSLNEDAIKDAMEKRARYLKENSENITISGVRRLLEDDLKIEKNSLDAYKGFIRNLLDEILYSEVAEPAVEVTKKNINKLSSKAKSNEMNKASKGSSIHSEASNDNSSPSEAHSSDDQDEENEEKKTKLKKRNARELKVSTTKVLKKQKTSSKQIKSSNSAKKKTVEIEPDSQSSDIDGGDNPSKNDSSDSSADESSKKEREKPAPLLYGKKVEHLKSVIKSCGLIVPPLVYKRVKQAPESKREALLIKELEGILEKEDLSTNPSEKEIKAVRKKKERAKELEGIDMSNIVSSSRRRTTSSFIPPKPTPPVESDEEDEEDEENEDDSEDENSDNEVSNEESEEDGEASD